MASRIEEIRDHVFNILIDKSLLGRVNMDRVNSFIDLKHRVEVITPLGRDPHGQWNEEVRRTAISIGLNEKELDTI